MLVALLCVGWLMLAAWGAAQYRQASHRGPVLHAPMSVAQDPSDGTIYCASAAGRIHKYAANGLGQGAFAIDTGGESVRLSPAGPGRVAMAVAGQERLVEFDAGGRIVNESVDAEAYARFATAEDARSEQTSGVVVLDDGAIVERGSEGERVLVPSLPFPLVWFAVAPWTLVLSLFLSALGLMASFVWPFLARPTQPGVR